MDTLYCITWAYYDGSGTGVVRAYPGKARADQDMELLKEFGEMRRFSLIEMPAKNVPSGIVIYEPEGSTDGGWPSS